MAKLNLIPLDSYGTADYVSELEVYRTTRWGGFQAELVGDADPDGPGATILLRAVAWKGTQPRLVLARGDEGFRDWRELLRGIPEGRYTIRFVGSSQASRDPFNQWATHAPSDLLG